jgi:hypothetical protein
MNKNTECNDIEPWLDLWAAFLNRCINDIKSKSIRQYPERYEADITLRSRWVQEMALDINGINLQEMVK